MTLFITVLHVIVCVFLIAIVLLQRGKGAEIGAMFGGGGGGTMFGGRGAGSFLTRLTTGSAVVFMLTSLFLAYSVQQDGSDLFDTPAGAEQPASPFDAPAPAGAGSGDTGGFAEIEPAAPAAADSSDDSSAEESSEASAAADAASNSAAAESKAP